jgi:5'-3' exonuclease
MKPSEMLKTLTREDKAQENSEVLLIDGMNLFIRSFAVIKAMNSNNVHIGGLVGFLKSLNVLVRTLKPTKVICVMEGKGSTIARKNTNSEYKAQRAHKQITNWGAYDNKKDEVASIKTQVKRLMNYLKCLPITIMEVEKLEADDVIAYLAQKYAEHGGNVRIVSTDKDYYQLISPKISIYSPIRKVHVTESNVKEDILVPPHNYLLAKAIIGDDADNLQGVKGVGIKTLVKSFPALLESTKVKKDYILKISEENLGKRKIFTNIINSWDLFESNYSIMNLETLNLSEYEEETILTQLVENKVKEVKEGPFAHYLEVDLIDNFIGNLTLWIQTFNRLVYTS